MTQRREGRLQPSLFLLCPDCCVNRAGFGWLPVAILPGLCAWPGASRPMIGTIRNGWLPMLLEASKVAGILFTPTPPARCTPPRVPWPAPAVVTLVRALFCEHTLVASRDETAASIEIDHVVNHCWRRDLVSTLTPRHLKSTSSQHQVASLGSD
jgi:hypothetical protein